MKVPDAFWRPILFVMSVGLVPSIVQTMGQIFEAKEWEEHAGFTWDFSLRVAVLAFSIFIAFELLVAVLLFARRTWGLFALAGIAIVSLGLVFRSHLLRTQRGAGYVNIAVAVITIVTVVAEFARSRTTTGGAARAGGVT
ncbi:MAG TPA: hypothetical protein VGM13_16820 [Thermoanaerobaculia bacterium]